MLKIFSTSRKINSIRKNENYIRKNLRRKNVSQNYIRKNYIRKNNKNNPALKRTAACTILPLSGSLD